VFYEDSYWLIVNGNNGFLGNLFKETFILKLIKSSERISYYLLIVLILLFFLKSINFKISYILNIIKKMYLLFKRTDKVENVTINTEIEENVEPEVNQVSIQENFSFDKKLETEIKPAKFKLPTLEFLKQPTKKD
jgi:S-DNA-T family DNA segregation ATPase FtsK/SpoIIIE